MNGLSIKQASIALNIPYANAKVVNQTFVLEKRYAKKKSRFRHKNIDQEANSVIDRKLLYSYKPNPFANNSSESSRRTCGAQLINRSPRQLD